MFPGPGDSIANDPGKQSTTDLWRASGSYCWSVSTADLYTFSDGFVCCSEKNLLTSCITATVVHKTMQ